MLAAVSSDVVFSNYFVLFASKLMQNKICILALAFDSIRMCVCECVCVFFVFVRKKN